jgi:hypothetical protein
MGKQPISGAWVAKNTSANAQDYSGALKWGTGINPVHSIRWEGAPLRTTGRNPGPDDPTPGPSEVPGNLVSSDMYGYSMEDIASLAGNYVPMTPGWGTETESLHAQNYSGMPDWGVEPFDPEATEFRSSPEAAPIFDGRLYSYPTETVSEGWENKTAGDVLAARTSDPAQYERQTSMQQVNPAAGRNNGAATARGTDDPRANIMTRLTGMKRKPWSTGERLEDMFPYQQLMGVRPFWYRSAATGDPSQLEPNAMYVSEPIERVVPPDPDLGIQETELNSDYGYTGEDMTYG